MNGSKCVSCGLMNTNLTEVCSACGTALGTPRTLVLEDTEVNSRRDGSGLGRVLEINWQRRLSVAIAILYVVIHLLISHPKSFREVAATVSIRFLTVLFPLACIWFGDEMGDYVGVLPIPSITKPSPGWLVRLGGWVLLCIQLIIWWVIHRE